MSGSQTFNAIVGAVTVLVSCCDLVRADRPDAPASLAIVDQKDDSLALVVTDTDGHRLEMRLTRPKPDAPWRVENLPPGSTGIWFGNPNPTFAGTARLRRLGISPQQAVQTFTASISTRPLDDITIYRVDDNDMVVALWEQGVITEIWYVGELVDSFDTTAGSASACEQPLERCRRTTLINPPPPQPPLSYPNPHIPSCLAVIASCGPSDAAAACNCLYQMCIFCWMRTPNPAAPPFPGWKT